MNIITYKDLIVWQKSMDLVEEVYTLTNFFPREELYGIVSQMRRCAISIPSNIAEGKRRGTRKDFRQFIIIAFGSASELETQIEISKRLKLGGDCDYSKIDVLLEEVLKMLNVLVGKLQPTT